MLDERCHTEGEGGNGSGERVESSDIGSVVNVIEGVS